MLEILVKRQLIISIRYTFPAWLAARALTISGTSCDLSGYESNWALKIPVFISSNMPVWDAIYEGNIDWIRKEIPNGLKPHMTVDEFGQSLFHVSTSQITRIWCLVASSRDFDRRTDFHPHPQNLHGAAVKHCRRVGLHYADGI